MLVRIAGQQFSSRCEFHPVSISHRGRDTCGLNFPTIEGEKTRKKNKGIRHVKTHTPRQKDMERSLATIRLFFSSGNSFAL